MAKSQTYIPTLLAFILLFFAQSIFSQNGRFQFVNFNENDGLPDLFVYSCVQSADGRIWLGTGSGLYAYDGNEFQAIKSPLDTPNAQIGNILERVFISSKQQLFLSSLTDFQMYDYQSESFIKRSSSDANGLVKEMVTSFSESPKGEIWITTQKGFCGRFNPITHKFVRLPRKDGLRDLASFHALSIIHTSEGELYVLTKNGMVRQNMQSGKQKTIPIDPSLGQLSKGIYDSTRNCLWLSSTTKGVVKYDLLTGQLSSPFEQNERLQQTSCTSIAWKSKNELWFGGNDLAFCNLETGKIEFVESKYEDENSFKTVKIQQLFIDRDKNTWICSHFGLSLLPKANQLVQNIVLVNPETGFFVEPYETIQLTNGDYLTAASLCRGVVRFNCRLNSVSVIPIPGRILKDQQGAWSIYKSSDKRIFVGARDGLFEYDEEKNVLHKVTLSNESGKPIEGVKKIVGNGSWIYFQSNESGFFRYHTRTKDVDHFYLSSNHSFSTKYSTEIVKPQCVDNKGLLWLSSENGVYSFDPVTLKTQIYASYSQEGKVLPIGSVSCITQDSHGSMWFSSINNGIYRLDQGKKTTIVNFNKANTLLFPSDYCFRIVSDKSGFVWVSTLSGLMCFDGRKEKVLSVLKKKNGLHKTNVDVGLSMLNGEILIVNNFGVLSVVPVMKMNDAAYHPKITQVEIAGVRMHHSKHSFELSHDQNFLRINWKSGAFGKRKQVLFAYRLINASEKWQYTNETSSNFVGLQPGVYTFQLKARNESGEWSRIDSIRLVIHPPFYQTTWFYLSIIIVIGTLIVVIYRYNISKVKEREQHKNSLIKQVAEIELKALRAQMNPHFVFNSLNSIQKFVLKNDSFTASLYLTKFARLIRLILENSNESHHSIGKEIEQIKLYLEIEQLRFENKFRFTINVDPSLRQDFTKIPSMIIQPYIENAIWHGLLHKNEPGQLTVSMSLGKDDCVEIIVEDNGVGRTASAKMKAQSAVQKQSLGIKITEDRIALLNKLGRNKASVEIIDLMTEDGIALGTRVELIIEVN